VLAVLAAAAAMVILVRRWVAVALLIMVAVAAVLGPEMVVQTVGREVIQHMAAAVVVVLVKRGVVERRLLAGRHCLGALAVRVRPLLVAWAVRVQFPVVGVVAQIQDRLVVLVLLV